MDANTNNSRKHRKKSYKTLYIVLFSTFIIIGIIYLLLPAWILNYTNKKLSSMREFYGHIESIDLHLFSGKYRINNMFMNAIDTSNNDTIPLFKLHSVDMTVSYKNLMKKKLLASVFVESPELIFINKKEVKEKAKKAADTISVKQLLSGIMPFTIERFEIHNGKIKYTDQNVTPELNLDITNLQLVAEHLSNIEKNNKLLPSSLNVKANVYEGLFDMDVFFNLLRDYPTFDMKMKLNELNLVYLNDFLREYAKLDLDKGKFSLTSEFAAKNGNYEGYVKPFVKDFEVKKPKKEESTIKKIWKKVVDTGMDILENNQTDKVATKVPVKGSFTDTNISIWEAITKVLSNAFIEALKPGFDNDINIKTVDNQKKKDENSKKKEDK